MFRFWGVTRLMQGLFMGTALLCLIAAAARGQSTAGGAITPTDEQGFQRAMQALHSGDLATAEPLLRALHTRHPGNFEINESLGLLYASADKLHAAAPLLRAAAQEEPDSDVAHANLGTALLKQGHTEDAARELSLAARLNPSDAATEVALGQAWMLLKRPDKAAAAFEAALAHDGSNPTLLYNTALALFDAGKAAEAEPLLARLPSADESPEAQSLDGDIEEQLGHYQDAVKHYQDAVRLAPTEANLYVLGTEFLRHWTFAAAQTEFEAGARVFPHSQRMRMGLGVAYYGAGKYEQAIPVFADLLADYPKNAIYAELLGRTCTVLTEGEQPRCASLATYALHHPADAILATYAATAILHEPADDRRLQQARQLLDSAIRADPRLPEAYYGMGLLLQTQSDWRQSIPELQAAIRLRPSYASAHYRLAVALSHVGDRERARNEIELEQKYSQQEHAMVDARLRQVTAFLVTMQ